MEFNLELLKECLLLSAPSGKEKLIKPLIYEMIDRIAPDAIVDEDDYGNMYVIKGDAKAYPTFAGHLDDVHDHYPDKKIFEEDGVLFAMDTRTMTQVGTAGDDKVGIFLCLSMLEWLDNVKLFFPVEEEMGTVGTSNCDLTFFDDSQYVIQTDRKGNEDMVVASSFTEMACDDFSELLERNGEAFGYKLCYNGGLTDVVTLKDRGIGVSCVNIASGYYRPHTDTEVVVINDVITMLAVVSNVVVEAGDQVFEHHYEFQAPTRANRAVYGHGWYYDAWDDERFNGSEHEISTHYEVCMDCNKPTEDGKIMCEDCIEFYNKEYGTDLND